MTIHELYKTNAYGFDSYNAWCRHFGAMFAKYPLECAEFGEEWLRRWEAVWQLLNARGNLESLIHHDPTHPSPDTGPRWVVIAPNIRIGRALCEIVETHNEFVRPIRIVLLDGTIIKEWNTDETP